MKKLIKHAYHAKRVEVSEKRKKNYGRKDYALGGCQISERYEEGINFLWKTVCISTTRATMCCVNSILNEGRTTDGAATQ